MCTHAIDLRPIFVIKADFEGGLDLARRCHALSSDAFAHQQMHATWPVLAALYHLGRWDELQARHNALKAAPPAKARWSGLPSDARRDFIDWIDSAKAREARKRRVERACAMLAAGKRQPPTERSA